MNLQDVLDAFNIQASPEPLSGGSQPTFKVGNVEDWEISSEKQAAELVIDYVQEKKR